MGFKEKISKEETMLLFRAAAELTDNGKTNICCPCCGGRLKLYRIESSYTIYCENQCCGVEARGI